MPSLARFIHSVSSASLTTSSNGPEDQVATFSMSRAEGISALCRDGEMMQAPLQKRRQASQDAAENIFELLTANLESAVREVLINLGILKALPLQPADLVSAVDLVQSNNIRANAEFVERLLRFATKTGFIKSEGNRYGHTPESAAFVLDRDLVDLFRLTRDEGAKTAIYLDAWATEQARRGPPFSPPNNTDNPTALREKRLGTDVFAILAHDHHRLAAFHAGLAAMNRRHPLNGFYDFGQRFAALSERSGMRHRIFLVDVGGANGRWAADLFKSYPNIEPQRVVIQDLIEPILAARRNEDLPYGVVFQEHDFKTAQVIKGAHFYHIRACLHDFGDEECVQILGHIAAAMEQYSALLVAENVLPSEISPHGHSHMMDIWMSLFGGKERTMADFVGLFQASGLRLRGTHDSGRGDWRILEAVLA